MPRSRASRLATGWDYVVATYLAAPALILWALTTFGFGALPILFTWRYERYYGHLPSALVVVELCGYTLLLSIAIVVELLSVKRIKQAWRISGIVFLLLPIALLCSDYPLILRTFDPVARSSTAASFLTDERSMLTALLVILAIAATFWVAPSRIGASLRDHLKRTT